MSMLRNFRLRKVALAAAAFSASTIILTATVNRNTGVAPLYVHVDTTQTKSTSTTKPYHEIEYRTVCSDEAMGMWTYGSKPGTMSKALQIGPLAGFTLENAGTFTLTTTAYIDGVASTPVTNIVIVTAADTHYAGATTICLSATGSTTGAPAGSTVLTGSDWGVALAKITTAGTVRRLVLNAGETFTAAGTQKTLAVLSGTPIHIGRYGSGANPKLSPPASEPAAGGFLSLSSATTAAMADVRFVDVDFDAGARVDDKLQGIGAGGGCDQATFLRCKFVGTQIGISLSENILGFNNTIADAALHKPQNAAFAGHHIWDQWAITDCEIIGASRVNTASSALPYGLYIGCAERLFVAGCLIDVNSVDTAVQRASHVIRINYSYKTIISNVTAKRPGQSRLCLKLCSSTLGNRQIQNVNVGTTAVAFSSAPTGLTSGTLNAAWSGSTGTYTVAFSNGEERQVPLTNGSAATGTWNKALGTVTTAATVYPLITPYLMAADPGNNGGGGTKYVQIADNDWGDATDTSTIMVAISGPSADGDGRGEHVIFERNYMHAGRSTQVLIQIAWKNVTVRNNLFDMRGGLYGEGIRIVREWTLPDPNTAVAPASGPIPDGIDIFNNSFSAPTAFGTSSFWAVNFQDATAVNVRIKNNVAYAPLDSQHKMIFEQVRPIAAYEASNNSSDAQVGAASPLWATTPPAVNTPPDWMLQAGSYGKNAGANVPVRSDFFGTVRTTSSMDMGATEQ